MSDRDIGRKYNIAPRTVQRILAEHKDIIKFTRNKIATKNPEQKQETRKKLDEMVTRLLPQIRGVPVVTLSALEGKGLDKLIQAACEIHDIWNNRLPTAKLNKWLADATADHPPPADRGRNVRLRYMTQPNARPPSFVVFSQRASSVPESYIRYLINGLREQFKLKGVPIRLKIRSRNNPYVED
ncbi:MAG: hypothetical protein JKY32_16215 [Rhizobiales bacterium]|nr:hypothetical protein [Hyphomicrobiales bacterium]